MDIDNLISQWGAYELKLLESGGGYPTKTILAAWGEAQGHSGFGSSIPIGLKFNNLTDDIVMIRNEVNELDSDHKQIMLAKHVLRLPERIIMEELGIGLTTIYKRLRLARKLIADAVKIKLDTNARTLYA